MDQDSAAQRSIETGPWSDKPTTKCQRRDRVLACLREDARAQVRAIARRALTPPSTVSHTIRAIRQNHRLTVGAKDGTATPTQETPNPSGSQTSKGC